LQKYLCTYAILKHCAAFEVTLLDITLLEIGPFAVASFEVTLVEITSFEVKPFKYDKPHNLFLGRIFVRILRFVVVVPINHLTTNLLKEYSSSATKI
jgi:hypothetical protein